jgi:predicted dehydrogenase
MKLRVAVAGAGVFRRHHMRVLQALETAELRGVYDLNANRAALACRLLRSGLTFLIEKQIAPTLAEAAS